MDIANSCRTCMKKCDNLVDLYTPLKNDGASNLLLIQVLIECAAVEVSKDDGLPQSVCEECSNVLHLYSTFREQAVQADNTFKKYLAEPNIKQEVEVKIEFNGDTDNFELCAIDTQDIYECSDCNKQFSNEKKYQKHVASHKLRCNICQKSFQRQLPFEKHMAKHADSGYKCTKCDLKFESNKLLAEHSETHGQGIKTEREDVFSCSECDMTFPKQRSLTNHMKKHKNSVLKELKEMSPKQQFVCDVCQKVLGSRAVLQRHLELHSKHKQFQCPRCPRAYARHDQLSTHLNKHDGLKPNVCPHCNKGFAQLCSLKEHVRTHTGETPFLCALCGRAFANGSNLRQHMARHAGLKPFACHLCPKTFCTKGQMTCHVSTHSGAHPYACEQCGAAFTKPNSLKKHRLRHQGLRPFACDTCHMRFTCKDHLKRHQRIHTGEKPYRCGYCERAFAQSNDLVKHTRHHLGQNIYQCIVCEMRFRLLSELKQHYPVHYGGGQDAPAKPDANTRDSQADGDVAAIPAPDNKIELAVDNKDPTQSAVLSKPLDSSILDSKPMGSASVPIPTLSTKLDDAKSRLGVKLEDIGSRPLGLQSSLLRDGLLGVRDVQMGTQCLTGVLTGTTDRPLGTCPLDRTLPTGLDNRSNISSIDTMNLNSGSLDSRTIGELDTRPLDAIDSALGGPLDRPLGTGPMERTIMITFNRNSGKDGLAGDITINIVPDKS